MRTQTTDNLSTVRVPLWRGLLEDARAGLGSLLPPVLFWMPGVVGVAILATFAHKPLFIDILVEDGPVEWTQFTLAMFTTLAAVLGAVRMARQRQYLAAALYVLFALGALVLGGEEISWGQRAFGLATPADLAHANDQGEFNLHNLNADGINLDALSDWISSLMSLVLLVLALTFRLPAALGRRAPALYERTWVKVLCPALVLVPSLVFSAFYSWLQLVPRFGSTEAFWLYEEWPEFCRYAALAALATEWTRRISSADPNPSVARRTDRMLIVFGVLSVLVTIVLAIMTIHTGIRPVNAPK